MHLDFWRNKSVFITGHTGFKGAWLVRMMQLAGAKVTGYALSPERGAAYEKIVDEKNLHSVIGDIRDFGSLKAAFDEAKPEVIFHMAAQPLVLDAFAHPGYTFDVNVQGTVNVLECIRQSNSVRSVVAVTTDKVYHNNEWVYGYRETDALGDGELYAASKACAEIAVASYNETFLKAKEIAVSTARAGNVIGGGDISANRIVPDCIRAAQNNAAIVVRNPYSVRPYQHVLEPLFAYLMIAQKQWEGAQYAGQYNIGPNESSCVTTAVLVEMFCNIWGGGLTWSSSSNANAPHESRLLKLDCAKMRALFSWQPIWDIETSIEKTVEWEKCENKQNITDRQIRGYEMKWMN
ncbi:CDP-glucose 4,6-dehydratase [Christensenellaceae bacterium OttesenSCG-928-M15]|nr:CDP-glucose 4,6-dehydratase [Christensenellaceae bacterium OttesenSCG-928-M15]